MKGFILRREKEQEITTEDLPLLLSGTKIKLDCGHYSTIGHSFANTIIIVSVGGGKNRNLLPQLRVLVGFIFLPL